MCKYTEIRGKKKRLGLQALLFLSPTSHCGIKIMIKTDMTEKQYNTTATTELYPEIFCCWLCIIPYGLFRSQVLS